MRLVAACLFFALCASAQPDKNFVYQIFVRSFADTAADAAPGGREIGDLRGIRENLDYLQNLHVGILWLMPIFPSASYHGYDIDDYRSVNKDYGTLQDLDSLVTAAHGRGMRVILDIAFNHTSTRHPWFRAAIRDVRSPEAKFYHVSKHVSKDDGRDDGRSARPPFWHVRNGVRYQGHFGPDMPDLNLDNVRVRQELKAVAKFWLDRGVDGFRLDAAKHIYDGEPEKNYRWWREFSDFVYSVRPDALLVGEVLGAPDALRSHAAGLEALLDAPFLRAARDYIVKPAPGFLHQWQANLQTYRKAHRGTRPFNTWPFLGSHDETPRLASFLHRAVPDRVGETYRLGLYLLFTLGKYPIVYHGDELMQPGVKWRGNPPTATDEPGDGSRIYDETLREPFPWHKAGTGVPQTSWFPPRYDKVNDGVSVEENPDSLAVVKSLARLRAIHPEFANGEVTQILEDSADWLVFEKGRYLVVVNPTATGRPYAVPPKWREARRLYKTSGDNAPEVPAYGIEILERN